jgi:SAM-dependent methyltransferase
MTANPLHAIWSAVAPAWNEHADYVDRRSAAVDAAVLAAADLQPGDEVLELGCGPGGLGIAAAEVVGAEGHVVLSDAAPEMTAIAEDRARKRGLRNVSVREVDMEHIEAADSSFDKVLGREALMLVADPTGAAREALRVLRPGGRAVFSVWGQRAANPWLGALLDAVGAQLGAPVPPPGVPGPFALSEDGALERVLSDAGFADVDVQKVSNPMTVGSFDEWWTLVPALAGPVSALLSSLPEDVTATIRANAEEALVGYAGDSGYVIAGVTLVGVGHHSGMSTP